VRCRVVVATHPAGNQKSRVGVTRGGVVYELFVTDLPQQAFTASDVVELSLHRGAFEPALADEDREQDPDRWCSHSAWGQECWQVISQWVWNLRLELGHQLEPTPLRTTAFAPALSPQSEQAATRLGKRVASPEPTFLSSLMGRSAVQQESLFTPRSGGERPMAVSAWCMRLAFATAAHVRCANSVNGMAARPRSHAR
jgi:hypothetical protein